MFKILAITALVFLKQNCFEYSNISSLSPTVYKYTEVIGRCNCSSWPYRNNIQFSFCVKGNFFTARVDSRNNYRDQKHFKMFIWVRQTWIYEHIQMIMSLRLWVEEVGQLKAMCGQWLWWQVQGLAWRWSWNSWNQRKIICHWIFLK